MKNQENLYNLINKQFTFTMILQMVKIEDMLLWYWVYKNVLEKNEESDYDDYDKEEYQERQEEIEEIMNEYWVDEDEAEEILDDM